MQSYILQVLSLLTIGLSFLNCRSKQFPVPDDQTILFEVTSSNFAWGRHHSGFFVDIQGNINVYKNPTKWNHLSAKGEISLAELNENLAQTSLSTVKIPLDQLNSHKDIIYTIDPDKLSKRQNLGADQGSREIRCYVYNSKTHVYRQILISESGDWNRENKDKPAQKIKEWLNEWSQKIK